MSWRRWPWLEEGVLPLLVLLLRLSWLWPWLLILGRWLLPSGSPPILSLWNAALLLAGGALTVRLLRVDPEKPQRARLLAAGIGLAALALTLWLRWERGTYALWDVRWLAHLGESLVYWGENVSVPFVTLLLAAWLWLRGMRDRPAPTHDDVWRAFVTGFVALALLLLIGRIDPAGLPEAAGRWIVLFFATGMAALALAGLRQARNVRQKDAPLLANRYWLTSILVTILALLAIGLALGVLITPESVAQIFGWTRVAASWLLALIGYVAYAAAYVLFLLLTPLIEWVQAHLGEPRPLEPAGGGQQFEEMWRERPPLEMPPVLGESMRWAGLAGVLAAIAVAFALALYVLSKRKDEEVDETRESILTAELLRDQASALWRRWRDRLRRGHPLDELFLSLAGEEPRRRAVRAAYQAFLAAMAQSGQPRRPRQTPNAYARDLAATLPAASVALETLTGRYVAARYGASAPDTEAAQRAQEAWAEIQAQMTAESAGDGHEDSDKMGLERG